MTNLTPVQALRRDPAERLRREIERSQSYWPHDLVVAALELALADALAKELYDRGGATWEEVDEVENSLISARTKLYEALQR